MLIADSHGSMLVMTLCQPKKAKSVDARGSKTCNDLQPCGSAPRVAVLEGDKLASTAKLAFAAAAEGTAQP